MHPDSPLLSQFVCPECRAPLVEAGADCRVCPSDAQTYPRVDGIWRMLRAGRAAHFDQFMCDYETIRRAEQRGSDAAAYYRALPYADLTGRWSADWAIRARSFDALIARVVQPLEEQHAEPLSILDLGAGNGWLSYRLALRRHHVAAMDLQTNPLDGLGAHRRYDARFLPAQAEFDALPCANATADLVIYNAALHYSESYERTLAEGLRVLRPGGQLVIVDSPIYRDAASGKHMVAERERRFAEQFGFPSDALPSEQYLTYDRLDALAGALRLRWSIYDPGFGWRWALRRWRARWLVGREPAQFRLVVGQPL